MKFAALNAGDYVIISHDSVVAKVKRHYTYYGPNGKWSKAEYRVFWSPYAPPEVFPTLAAIEEKYHFENADGYYQVLKRRN